MMMLLLEYYSILNSSAHTKLFQILLTKNSDTRNDLDLNDIAMSKCEKIN